MTTTTASQDDSLGGGADVIETGVEQAQNEVAAGNDDKSPAAAPATTLFDKLGGTDAVSAVVGEMYTRLLADPVTAPMFAETNMTRLKTHQMQFMKIAFTVVPDDLDVPKLLVEKHQRLFVEKQLNETHFDKVAEHFVGACTHLRVDPALIDEAVAVIAPLRSVFENAAKEYAAQNEAGVEQAQNEVTAGNNDKSPAAAPAMTTLFDKLGGVNALSAVVGEMYTRLLADPVTAPMFAETNIARLKMHQIEFMKIAFTVVPDDLDVPKLLVEKHQRLFVEKQLNETHFDKVAEHFVGACTHLGVDPALIDEAVAVIAPLRSVFENAAKEYAAQNE